VSGYNRRIRISRSHIARAGANGISFVGERKAVRNPLDSYDDRLGIGDLDLTPDRVRRTTRQSASLKIR